jgi:hypothetical protein
MNKADLVFKQLSRLYEFNRGLQAFKASARVRGGDKQDRPRNDRYEEKPETPVSRRKP